MLLWPAHDHIAKADAFAGMPKRVATDAPAETIVGLVGLPHHFRMRAEGKLARGIAQQAVVVKRGVPFRQIIDAGVDAAIATGGAGEILIGQLPLAIDIAVAVSAIRHGLGVMHVEQRVIHVQRREDALLKEILQAQTGRLLHYQAQQHVAGVAVTIHRARRKIVCVVALIMRSTSPSLSWCVVTGGIRSS